MTLLDKIFVILLLFSGSTTLMCLDTSGEGGFVPMRIYTFLVGFAMVSASIVMKHLVMDWVAIVEMKGSKKITPMWIKWQYWITVCMQTFSDVFLQQYEMHQDPRDAWSFNGTINAIKQIIAMTDYASWTFVGVYYGWNIKKILMFNKKKPTPEVLKIAKYCRLLVMMLVLSCSYKVMAIARVGKTIYNSPPCGGASWIKIIEIICIAINYYMIYVQKPTEEAIRKCDETSDQTSMGLGSALKHRFSSTSVSPDGSSDGSSQSSKSSKSSKTNSLSMSSASMSSVSMSSVSTTSDAATSMSSVSTTSDAASDIQKLALTVTDGTDSDRTDSDRTDSDRTKNAKRQ